MIKIGKELKLLRKLMAITDGKVWVMGSFLLGNMNSDIDIMIEQSEWYKVAPILSEYNPILSTYGGFIIKTDNVEYDIWCDTIERISRVGSLFTMAYNPITNIIVTKHQNDTMEN